MVCGRAGYHFMFLPQHRRMSVQPLHQAHGLATASRRTVLSDRLPPSADELIGAGDVGGIFVRTFRFLVHTRLVLLDDHVSQAARASQTFRDALDAFAPLIHWTALERDPAQPHDRFLSPHARRLLLESLVEFLEGASPTTVYRVLLALLAAIEGACGSHLVDLFYFSVGEGGACPFPLHPDRPFPKPREAFGTGIVSPDRLAPATGLPTEFLLLERYCSDLCVPHAGTSAVPIPALLRTPRLPDWEHDEWRIAVVSILGGFDEVQWKRDEARFWAPRLRRSTRRAVLQRLAWALRECRRESADLILLPELNGDTAVVKMLNRYLRRHAGAPGNGPIVFCGSMHEATAPISGTYRNRPLVLTPGGALAWPYWKMEPVAARFTVRSAASIGGGSAVALERRMEALGERPQWLIATDTRIGRICVVICKDFLADDCLAAVQQLRSNVVIVLSMTSAASVRRFQSKAADLAASSRAVTLFCNSSLHLRSVKKNAVPRLGFVHPNTMVSEGVVEEHQLPHGAHAVVGVYTLHATETDLNVSRSEPIKWLMPALHLHGSGRESR